MSAVTVALVGAADIAKELAKKGTASDITMFNLVHDEHALTLVEPTQFPEKVFPLLTALSMADRVLLVLTELTRPVAETIATLELVERPTTVVVGPAVGAAEVDRALKGGRLASAPRMPLDLPRMRELLDGWSGDIREGPVRVTLDHAFPVKGVGAVALGVVRRGTLRAHDHLRLFPTPKIVEVRSIQVHDIDRKDARPGERVGAALKDIDADELSRGQILAPDGSLEVAPAISLGPLDRCRYYRGDAAAGAQLHLSLDLQLVPVELEEIGPSSVRVRADRPVAFESGEVGYLLDLSVPSGPRLFGRATVTGASV